MSDITPPDFSTTIGQIRLLIPDIEQLDNLNDPAAVPEYLFSDAAIQALASLYSNNVKLAAAQAKLVLATSEALINKVIRTTDYTTDGAKLGAELRAQAKQLQDEAQYDAQVEAYDQFIVVKSPDHHHRWENDWL
jgi:organic hydroperoxide reductase OsmC/OhrA